MTEPVDPPRLDVATDVPELAQRAMRVARADLPTSAKLVAAEAALLARLGIGGSGGGGGDSGTGGGGPHGPGTVPPPLPPTTATATAGGPVGGIGAAGMTTKLGAALGVVAVSVAVVTAFVVSTPDPLGERARGPAFDPTSVASVASSPVSSGSALQASTSASPPTVSADDLPRASAAPAPGPRGSEPAPVEDPAAEVSLVSRAQTAARTSPAEALRLCEEHARRYPRGSLAQEREALAIEALVGLARREDAKARATRFKAAFPSSGHLRKLEAMGVLPTP